MEIGALEPIPLATDPGGKCEPCCRRMGSGRIHTAFASHAKQPVSSARRGWVCALLIPREGQKGQKAHWVHGGGGVLARPRRVMKRGGNKEKRRMGGSPRPNWRNWFRNNKRRQQFTLNVGGGAVCLPAWPVPGCVPSGGLVWFESTLCVWAFCPSELITDSRHSSFSSFLTSPHLSLSLFYSLSLNCTHSLLPSHPPSLLPLICSQQVLLYIPKKEDNTHTPCLATRRTSQGSAVP